MPITLMMCHKSVFWFIRVIFSTCENTLCSFICFYLNIFSDSFDSFFLFSTWRHVLCDLIEYYFIEWDEMKINTFEYMQFHWQYDDEVIKLMVRVVSNRWTIVVPKFNSHEIHFSFHCTNARVWLNFNLISIVRNPSWASKCTKMSY